MDFLHLLLVSCARSMYVSTSKHGQQPGEERGRRRMDEEEAREEERRSRQARETAEGSLLFLPEG